MGMTIEQWHVSFELDLDGRNLSPATLTTYGTAIQLFDRFLRVNRHLAPESVDVDAIEPDDIRAFMKDTLQHNKPATASVYYRSLKQFFQFIQREHPGDYISPMAELSPPTVPEEPVPVLRPDQVGALLATCSKKTFNDLRDEALVRVLLDCGLRNREILSLKVPAVDLKRRTVVVLGKGRRERIGAFGARTAVALDKYLRMRYLHKLADTSDLWLTDRGPLQKSGLASMLERRGKKAGIGRVHPHQFRHTFAHEWKLSGGSEDALMELAGWQTREMLGRYGKSARAERAREEHKRHSPGDKY